MTREISTCLWFDGKAKQAMDFYATVFNEVVIISENPLAVNYSIHGRRFMNLNGGPGYAINSSISFFINVESEQEAETLWEKLIQGGTALMPLGSYPWSIKYGWCADQYGVNWQIMLNHQSSMKIMPSLLFTQENAGKAAEAIQFYTQLIADSTTTQISHYEKGEQDKEGFIKYAQFELMGQPFGAMDSSAAHLFNFTEGISFIISVDTQEEIDYYWNAFLEGGKAGRCGWIKDKYGLSWQVVPSIIGKLMSNPITAPKATYAFLQMSKFIIADLEKAVQ